MVVKDTETFHIKATLPANDGSLQYGIRSGCESHERVTPEGNIEEVEVAAE